MLAVESGSVVHRRVAEHLASNVRSDIELTQLQLEVRHERRGIILQDFGCSDFDQAARSLIEHVSSRAAQFRDCRDRLVEVSLQPVRDVRDSRAWFGREVPARIDVMYWP